MTVSMKKIFLFTLIYCFSVCSFAADWQRYGSVYVDNYSVTKLDSSVQAWVIHADFVKSKPINKTYLYEMALYDAKCKEREMAVLNTAWYNKYHQMEYHPIAEISYLKILPKTNNEIIFKAICSQEKIL